MITVEDYKEAIETVKENWGENVVTIALNAPAKNISLDDFLNHCVACGGNWGGMLLTGIRELYPEVYDAVPENMGAYAFTTICNLLTILKVDASGK